MRHCARAGPLGCFLLFSMFATFFDRSLRTQQGHWRLPMLIGPSISLALLVVTALYWNGAEVQLEAQRSAAFRRVTERIVDSLEDRIAAYEIVLRGLKGYYEGSESIDRAEFHAYVEQIKLQWVLPGLQAVAYVRQVRAEQAASYQAQMRLLGFPGYRVTPAGVRAEYRPIALIEPQSPDNLHIVGVDTALVPEALEAQNLARDTALPTITRGLLLRQDVGLRAARSVVMYLPLYQRGVPLETMAQRRAALEGWVSGPFRIQDFVEGIARLAEDEVSIAIFDGAQDPESLLYRTPGYVTSIPVDPQAARILEVGGRTWTVATQPLPVFAHRFGAGQRNLIALLAVMLSLMIGWVAWFLSDRRDQAVRLAERMTQDLRTARDDLQATLDATPDWMVELDAGGRVLHCHNAIGSPLYAQVAQLLGRSLPSVATDATSLACRAALEVAATRGYSSGYEFELMLDGQGRWFELSAARKRGAAPDDGTRFVALLRDISERKQAAERTHRLAYFNPLTGLPNRRMLLDRLEHSLSAAAHAKRFGALIFLDLDNFKHINDAHGHSAGDALLVQVAERLVHAVPSTTTVAHIGGDEFVVLVGDLSDQEQQAALLALELAQGLRDALDAPFRIGGNAFSTTGSIGLTLFPKKGQAVGDLLREADTAMYHAKDMGRNRMCFFELAMQADVHRRLTLEQDLKAGFAQAQLSAHVQPQVNAGGEVVGAELLMRWQHPLRGAVSPAEFIPIAEASDLIVQLGDWMLEQACDALAQLQSGGALVPLSVNVSQRQFRGDGFVAGIKAMLARTGARADHLVLEVTESLLAVEMEQTISRMAELVALGVRFSIDDFGTGYSSLAYLKRMPIHELKIDKSFVQDTPADPSDTAIVQTILAVASNLGLRVVAEGVETQAQADFLLANRCDVLQGYLFARPEPLADWVARRVAQVA